jgi:formyltetrahydrofolate deformylase
MKDSAVLLIDCPDQKGLVARVSSLLYQWGANILHADQHQDHELGLFFMRVEWALDGLADGSLGSADDSPFAVGAAETHSKTPLRAVSPPSSAGAAETHSRTPLRAVPPPSAGPSPSAGPFDLEGFKAAFAPLARELGMRWKLSSTERMPRVALFCSQYLHCMADLLYRWRTGELPCEIPVIVSNHHEVEKLAGFYGIPFEFVEVAAAERVEAEARQLKLLESLGVELVVLARYMQVLSPAFVARYPAAIINVHHSFLPAFTGAKPYHAAHARGVKLIGATSHYVTDVLDDGPIIEQDVTRISHRDQVEDLVARGRDLERIVLSRAVRWHLDRRILCYGNKTVVFD